MFAQTPAQHPFALGFPALHRDRDEPVGLALDDRLDDLLLVGEVVVDVAEAAALLARDVAQREPVEPRLHHAAFGRLDDFEAAPFGETSAEDLIHLASPSAGCSSSAPPPRTL